MLAVDGTTTANQAITKNKQNKQTNPLHKPFFPRLPNNKQANKRTKNFFLYKPKFEMLC
jgi:hypothetical protein